MLRNIQAVCHRVDMPLFSGCGGRARDDEGCGVRCISLCPFNPSVTPLSSQNGVPRSCAYSVITFPVKLLTNIPNSASSALLLSQPRSLSLPSTCPPLLWLPTTVPCPLRLSVRADPLLAKRLDWHIQLAACFIAKSLVYVASDLPYA